MEKKPSREEYDVALDIVKKYNVDLSKEYLKPYTCACCHKTEIKRAFPEFGPDPEYYISIEDVDKIPWIGGTVIKFRVGFGSSHDSKELLIAICDKCITKLEKRGDVRNVDDIIEKLVNNGAINTNRI